MSPYQQTDPHRDKYADTEKSIVLSSHFSDQQSDKSIRILMNTASEMPLPAYFVKVLKSENQVCLQGVGGGGVTEMQVLDLIRPLVVPLSCFLTLPWCFPTQARRKGV